MAQQTATAESITAAFLLNFARFTEWPAEALPPSAPLVLCVVGESVASALESASSGRSVGGRRVEVRRVTPAESTRTCSLLFIGRDEGDRLPDVLPLLRGASVLTVSDAEAFAERGGIVQLYIEGGRMRFAINIRTARAARLSLSAQLLNLARIIGE